MTNKRLVICMCASIFALLVKAQDNSLHFMHRIPQSISTNPAIQHPCNVYIELPAISSIEYAYNNTGFGYHDVAQYGTGERKDSIIFNIDALYNTLKPVNYIRNDIRLNLLGFGFRAGTWFFTFNANNNTQTRIGFARDIFAIFKGNWDIENQQVRDLNLSGFSVNVTNYTDFGISVSKRITENFTFGLKAKYLWGTANLSTAKSRVLINTDGPAFVIEPQANIMFNASFPIDVSYDSIGIVSDIDDSRIFSDPINDYILNDNRGYGLDVGLLYKATPKLTLSASMTDFGWINWRSNVQNYEGEGYFSYKGQYVDENTEIDVKLLNELLDSLQQSISFSHGQNAYKTWLMTKAFAGGTYQLHKMVNVGLLSKVLFYDKKMFPSFTASLNLTPLSWLSASVTYSIMNRHFANLGGGIAIGGPLAQLYFVTDNIPVKYVEYTNKDIQLPFPIVFPYNARSFSFRFGINLVFGCHKKDNDEDDNDYYHGSGKGKNKGYRPKSGSQRSKRPNTCPAYKN